jgi:Holliday junction resolvasome RuvABC endonuclease subunit
MADIIRKLRDSAIQFKPENSNFLDISDEEMKRYEQIDAEIEKEMKERNVEIMTINKEIYADAKNNKLTPEESEKRLIALLKMWRNTIETTGFWPSSALNDIGYGKFNKANTLMLVRKGGKRKTQKSKRKTRSMKRKTVSRRR